MNILVCIKPAVPGTAIRYAKDSGQPYALETLRMASADAAALQFALELRAAHGGRVSVVSVGGERADEWLQHCLDHGADRALRIDELAVAERQDTARAARLIAPLVREEDVDLVLCASRSADMGSGFFPYALAAAAGFPVVTRVVEVGVDAGELTAVRKLERGWRERYRLPLPLVLAVEETLRAPRHVAMFSHDHRRGMHRTVEVLHSAAVAAVDASTTGLMAAALRLPQPRRRPAARQRAVTSARDRLRRKPAGAPALAPAAQTGGDADAIAAQLIAKIRSWLVRVTDESST